MLVVTCIRLAEIGGGLDIANRKAALIDKMNTIKRFGLNFLFIKV